MKKSRYSQAIIVTAISLILVPIQLAQAKNEDERKQPGLSEPTTDLVIKASRMLDVESGSIVENPFILVQGRSIKAVATTPPSGQNHQIDLGDMTILPGLMELISFLRWTKILDIVR
jgi:hypothetical protein